MLWSAPLVTPRIVSGLKLMKCFARDYATGFFLVLKVVFSADRFVLKMLVHHKILLLLVFEI